MIFRYNIVCPKCGYIEERSDENPILLSDSNTIIKEFGELCDIPIEVVKDSKLVKTNSFKSIYPCPKCNYKKNNLGEIN